MWEDRPGDCQIVLDLLSPRGSGSAFLEELQYLALTKCRKGDERLGLLFPSSTRGTTAGA
jgi:hypothetical protein